MQHLSLLYFTGDQCAFRNVLILRGTKYFAISWVLFFFKILCICCAGQLFALQYLLKCSLQAISHYCVHFRNE